MKKLKRFLTLALLTVTCCFSAHAKIDGKPATQEQHREFIENMKKFAIEYAEKSNYQDLTRAEENTLALDREKNMYNRTAQTAHILYTVAIKQFKVLSCRACASFALIEMENRGIQCGYVQGYFDHLKSVRHRVRGVPLPELSFGDAWHDTVVYSVKNAKGIREWYVCDMQLALHDACAELNSIPSGLLPFIRPEGTDYSYFFAIPLDTYIEKYAMPGFENVITVRKDDCRDKVLRGCAVAMKTNLSDLLSILGGKISPSAMSVIPTFHFSLSKWLEQANAIPMI